MREYVSTIITIAGFVLTAVGMLVAMTWKLSGVVIELKDAIAKARNEADEQQQISERRVGETVAALRQKVNDVELSAANTYVRRDGFYKVRDELADDIRTLGDSITKRLERMENKIDSKT